MATTAAFGPALTLAPLGRMFLGCFLDLFETGVILSWENGRLDHMFFEHQYIILYCNAS